MERPPCSWIKRINVGKMAILSKATHRFYAIIIKIPVIFFTERERNCKVHMEDKRSWLDKAILSKKSYCLFLKVPPCTISNYITKP